MPLEVVQGESRDRTTARALSDYLQKVVHEGTLYLGYPVLATADDQVDIDALLVSSTHGLVAFQLSQERLEEPSDATAVVDAQDRLYQVLVSHLGRHETLRSRRNLKVDPQTATVFASPLPQDVELPDGEGFYGDLEEVSAWLQTLEPITEEVEKAVHAALQRVTTIKPRKKRSGVQTQSSRGAKLKQIEKGIANLDSWQKAAAIESPEGPQRIRGLAGSGKTVVLALKAAYLHAQHPDWDIALTFHSRALYQQIDDLVTRFSFEHSNDRPDDERLRILHSWGSRGRPGIYSMIAMALDEVPRDWSYARGKYGMQDAFQGVCRELLTLAKTRSVKPIFDAVLVDEAQDLPPEFFQLVYLFTREPRRIVWGYDELQKLSETAMPTTNELFGLGASGEPLISLDSAPGDPRRDIVLPVCYRNTPWALSIAHALGLGVYRDGGLLQHPDEPLLWKDIGYNVLQGELAEGSRVQLERSLSSYPSYFSQELEDRDAVVVEQFEDESQQDSWIAAQIMRNLTEDELEHDDILIVLPDSYRAKTRAPRLMRELRSLGIESHLVGVNTSVDEVFQPGSVALAHIYRAKGNEAPMVYAVDAHRAATSFNTVTARNTLFTAITRSRAWVRVTGYGDQMAEVKREIEEVQRREYRLDFTIPTAGELRRLRHVNRERSESDEAAFTRATAGFTAFIDALENDDLQFEDLPPALRTRFAHHLHDKGHDGDS